MTTAPADTAKHASPPESPTTVRPFEMDDDDAADTSVVEDSRPTQTTTAATAPTAAPTAATPVADAPPTKPPRPQTEQQKNETMLKEAFPSVDLVVIKAILSASRGQIEPAFNALLEMTDPDASKGEPEDVPPPQPPRPNVSAQSQLEADERLARQLAEHYQSVSAYEARTQNRPQDQARGQGFQQGHHQSGDYPARGSSRAQHQQQQHHHSGDPRPFSQQDREYSFIDDDLPMIRDQVRKGFVETQTKVNGWINVLKKKIDETFEEGVDGHSHGTGSASAAGSSGFGGRTFGGPAARPRSSDYDRYDADPEVLSDDFAGIKLAPDGTASPHNRPSVFKPPPPSTSPRPGERKVGFKDETEEIHGTSPRFAPKDGPLSSSSGSALKPATKASKWQPLATVESTPMAENDPFSLGDSDDEKEMIKDAAANSSGGGSSSKPPSAQDSERLKKAAAEAMSESLVEGGGSATGDATAAAKKD